MQTRKVSVIVPVYNVEPYLRRCLDSILAQTFTDFEAVLVDDGSTDGSGAICDEYAATDSRFVVVHKGNEGVAQARLTAFEHSKGELITFVDADDYVTPEYIRVLSDTIERENADMVSCDYYRVEKGKIISPSSKFAGIYEKDDIKDFIRDHYFYDKRAKGYGMTCFLCTKIVKRQYVAEGLKKGIGLWFGEDQLSMFAMLVKCRKLVLIADRLYYYVQHDGQAVKRYDISLWENIISLLTGYLGMLPAGVSRNGVYLRTWLFIDRTISGKMIPVGVSLDTFEKHISFVRNHPSMGAFFSQNMTGLGWKEDVKFWLLKLRMYRLYYIRLKRKLICK